METIEQTLNQYGVTLLVTGTIALLVLAAISLKVKKLSEKNKEILFFGIIAATVIPTLFLAISTVYINMISASGGPVHWHADLEILACSKELDLRNPEGLSNKIGTATLHEHNDKRIHVEGVVVEPHHVSLGSFFQVIGGELTSQVLVVPSTEGDLSFISGGNCPDGQQAQVQVFVYTVDDEGYYSQQKLEDPHEYVLTGTSNVPNGDCIIVEYGPKKEKTKRVCRSYRVAEEIGKLKGEKDGN